MAGNLLDMIKGSITPGILESLAGYLGVSPEQTRSAVDASIPSILAGLVNTASRPSDLGKVIDATKDIDLGSILNQLPGALGEAKGQPGEPGASSPLGGLLKMAGPLLALIFGAKALGGVTETIGKASGVGSGLIGKLLPLLLPIILGNLGKALAGGLNPSKLLSLLMENKDSILGAAPQGLASSMGLASLNDLGKNAADTAARAVGNVASEAGGLPKWLVPVVGLAALGLLAYLFWPKEQGAAEQGGGAVAPAEAGKALPTAVPKEGERDIVDAAAADPQLSTLVKALQASDIASVLKDAGPYTLFAPSNAAFEKLPAGTLDELLKPEKRTELNKILSYHMIANGVKAEEVVKLNGQEVESNMGGRIPILVESETVMVGKEKAKVIKADIEAVNGIIHVIDTVIMPPSAPADAPTPKS
jgi:uncharacterized surface protein with fasciclin (FAS1) repeats